MAEAKKGHLSKFSGFVIDSTISVLKNSGVTNTGALGGSSNLELDKLEKNNEYIKKDIDEQK